MRALNFYSTVYHGNLLERQKYCTIRLGDKSKKYADGDLVWVTVGDRFKPRQKVYTAVLDRVMVKPLKELTKGDLQGESSQMRSVQDAVEFLSKVYGREVSPEELVTVIYFSEVRE